MYPQLSDYERKQREEFVVEASYLMRDRFQGEEVWEQLGLPVKECVEYLDKSDIMVQYRKMLFTRIVPTIKHIGLWGPTVQKAYADMGVIEYCDVDVEGLMEEDDQYAINLDVQKREVAATIETGRAASA